jgi:hypothetical protein
VSAPRRSRLTLSNLWHNLWNKLSNKLECPLQPVVGMPSRRLPRDPQRATTMRHLHAVPAGDDETSQAACWQEFWEVVGKAAYRIWREDQLAELSTSTSETEGKAA